MDKHVVDIYPIKRYKKGYICELTNKKTHLPESRYLKDIEEVRCVGGDRRAEILERNAHCIDYCDNDLC